MKNVLIPTDFTIKSLKLITAAVARFKNETINVTLVHALEPDHSISGLLMLNRRMKVNEIYTQEFRDACEVLRNKYASNICRLTVDFYYGTTKYYKNSYLEGRQIDAIIFPADYKLQMPSKASNNMVNIFGKSKCAIYHEQIAYSKVKTAFEEASISELLMA
jgi:hypothetical protein